MRLPGSAYDEVGSRTRQAWLRTSLALLGVTALVERGLAVAGAPPMALVLALLPAVIGISAAVHRSATLRYAASGPVGGVTVALAVAGVAGVVLVGLGSVLA